MSYASEIREYHIDRFGNLIDQAVKNDAANARLHGLLNTLKVTSVGTFKKWCQLHNGESVESVQLCFHPGEESIKPVTGFAPGARTLDARGTFALFNDSRVDYPGTSMIGVSDRAVAVTWDAGKINGKTLQAYALYFVAD